MINDYPQICSLQHILLAVKPAEKQEDFTKSDLDIYYLDPVWLMYLELYCYDSSFNNRQLPYTVYDL